MEAIKYIDENGVPDRNTSTGYELVTGDGKKYPPKYVIAVARHLATGDDIVTDDFNAVEARTFLEKMVSKLIRSVKNMNLLFRLRM